MVEIATEHEFERLILFDGVCGLCDHLVQWLLRKDTHGVLKYAPLQGETAEALRQRHEEIPRDLDTVVFVERRDGGEVITLRSRAVFSMLRAIDTYPILRAFRVLPAPLTDLGYRFVAAIRYRVFGKLDTCRVPTPDERARFLP